MVVGEFTREVNLVVIGGGPGGFAAALRAAELGVVTVIVDPLDTLGGNALHYGSIGLKTMLQMIRVVDDATALGVKLAMPRLDAARLQRAARKRIEEHAAALDRLCRERSIEVIRGAARFEGPRQLVIADGPTRRFRFRKAVIATGARLGAPPGGPSESPRIMDWRAAVDLKEIPTTLLVIGGGPVALELASVYAALGTEVTLATPDERILAAADPDLVRPLATTLDELLAEVRTGTCVTDINVNTKGVEVRFQPEGDPGRRVFDRVLAVQGSKANTDGLDTAKARIELDANGAIRIDHQQQTSNPRIYAVGDVTGEPYLVEKARHQGRVAAEVIAGGDSVFDARALPRVIFTDPPIAWCGLTEQEARNDGIGHLVSTVCGDGSPAGAGIGRGEPMTKLIVDPETKRLLGVGLAGPGAAQLIALAALAIEMGAVAEDLAGTVLPYPAMSGPLGEAARQIDR